MAEYEPDNVDQEEMILEMVERSPSISVRRISSYTNEGMEDLA